MTYYFEYNGSVYSTPFSDSGIDFMDGAEMVYHFPKSPARLARLLEEHSHFCSMLEEYEHIPTVKTYCIKHIYSLSYRIGKLIN